MFRYLNVSLLLITCILLGKIGAQPDSLTLSQAIRMSRENNITLQQQQLRIEQAAASSEIQKSGYFPTLDLGGMASYVSELARLQLPFRTPAGPPITIEAGVKNQYDLNLTLNQPVFTGFRRTNLIRYSDEQVLQNRAERKAIRNQVNLQIHILFYSSQLNLLQQKVMKSSLNRTRLHLQSIINLLKAEQATPYDTMKISNRDLEVKTGLAKLKYTQKILLSRLTYAINGPEIKSVKQIDSGSIDFTLNEESAYLAMALKNRPELSGVRHKIQAGRFQKRALKAAYFPQVFARASYHYAKPGVNFFQDKWMDYYTLGVDLQWQIWNWGKTKNQVRQAEYAVRTLTLEEQKQIDFIEQEVKEAYQNLLSDLEQITLAKKLVFQEKERYRMVKEKFDQGLATATDLTDAESDLTNAELSLAQNHINWLLDKSKMAFATGQIADEQGD